MSQNFADILIFFPLHNMKRPALQNKQVVVSGMAFQACKVFGAFEKHAWPLNENEGGISFCLCMDFIFQFLL